MKDWEFLILVYIHNYALEAEIDIIAHTVILFSIICVHVAPVIFDSPCVLLYTCRCFHVLC